MILRNPVERLYSQFLMNIKLGKIAGRDLIREIQNDQAKEFKGWGVSHLYLEVGSYYEQVKRYYDVFPKEQIRVIIYDDYKKDPTSVLRDLFLFLGVDPAIKLDMSRRYNEAGVPRFGKLNYWLTQIGVYGLIKRMFSPGLKERIKKIIYSGNNIPEISASERQYLLDYYKTDVGRLSTLIGRDLSAWMK